MSVPIWGWIMLAFIGLLLGCQNISNEDLGFQLHAAKVIIANADVPRVEPFLWTEPNGSYIDMQWLWQIGIYSCWQWFGYKGLGVINITLQLVAMAIWLFRVRGLTALSLSWGSWILLFGFIFLNNWAIRPHTFSWIYLGLVLWVLERSSRGRYKTLWLLPLIFIFWVNTHALYSLGLIAVGIWMVGHLFDIAVFSKKDDMRAMEWPSPLLVWCVLASVAICLVNPYGWDGFMFPIKQASIVAGKHEASNYIYEFQPLWRLLFPEAGYHSRLSWIEASMALSLILVLLIGIWLERTTLLASSWLIILIFGLFAVKMGKNFSYFFFFAGPYAAAGLDRFLYQKCSSYGKLIRNGMIGGTLAIGLTIPTGLMSRCIGRTKFGMGFDPRVHPTEVCQPLVNCGQKVRLLNGHDLGGWIGWITGKKVFVDARNDNYSESLLVAYMESRNDPIKFANLLRKYRINAVFVRFEDEPVWVPTLMELNRQFQQARPFGEGEKLWRCVARDLHTALFFRYDICAELREVKQDELTFNIPSEMEHQIDLLLSEMSNKPSVGWKALLLPADIFPVEINSLVARSIEFGEIESAKKYAIYGMQQCEWFYPSLWANLAYAFDLEGEDARADYCWQTIIHKTEDPQWLKKQKARILNRKRIRDRNDPC